MTRLRELIPAATRGSAVALLAVALFASPVWAQATPTGLRPYWHVFIAYAIAIVLIMAWAISIARRLGDLEKRLGE